MLIALAGTCYTRRVPLRRGDLAPSFRLQTAAGGELGLDDLRGRWVVLVFLRYLG